MKVNMEKMMNIMTEQFNPLTLSVKKPSIFPSQVEVNPKGLTLFSCSESCPNDNVRNTNVVVSLR